MIVVFNGGSSSWKSAVFEDVAADASATSAVTTPPLADVTLRWEGDGDAATIEIVTPAQSRARSMHVARTEAVATIVSVLRETGIELGAVRAVGHRIVHGGARFRDSVRLDDDAIAALRELEPLAPSHNPLELAGIAAATAAFPSAAEIAVFDTAFHRTLPPAAYAYAGPYAWLERNVRRYGFHGINVAYCRERVASLLDADPARVRAIVAHLGGGCSVTALLDGASVDTTMGFTPLDGIAMATRSGSVDPGILTYLLRRSRDEGTPFATAIDELDATLNRASGIRGLSGISGDVRPVLAAEARGEERARLALDVFVHRLATAIAGMMPSLERLDALVFTGGIGEHATALRERTCAKLGWLGVALDPRRNRDVQADADIANAGARIRTFVITAREEWTIARECARVLA